jgi:lipoate-protein ligase A
MQLFDTTFEEPKKNIEFDEELLDAESGEAMRFWESASYFVVLGAGNKKEAEVRSGVGVPVLKRVSGGGCVLQGPGCLNYALILDTQKRPELSKIDSTNRYVMERNCAALRPLVDGVEVRGITDLAVGGLKFSGNAQRRKRRFILFHGTFLYGFDISMIEKTLNIPEKQPDYRLGRSHRDFLTNVALDPADIKQRMKDIWKV